LSIELAASGDQLAKHRMAAGQTLHREFLLPGRPGPLEGEEIGDRRRPTVEEGSRITFPQLEGDPQRPRLKLQGLARGFRAALRAHGLRQSLQTHQHIPRRLRRIRIGQQQLLFGLQNSLRQIQGAAQQAVLALEVGGNLGRPEQGSGGLPADEMVQVIAQPRMLCAQVFVLALANLLLEGGGEAVKKLQVYKRCIAPVHKRKNLILSRCWNCAQFFAEVSGKVLG